MKRSIITKRQLPIGELKDMENTIANAETLQAFIDYNIMLGNIENPIDELEEFEENEEA